MMRAVDWAGLAGADEAGIEARWRDLTFVGKRAGWRKGIRPRR